MTTLPEHLERFLGPIQGGWSKDAAGNDLPFHVVRCDGGLLGGVTAYATLGLSRFPLRSPASGRDIRHELLMIVRSDADPGTVPGLLQQLGLEALGGERPFLAGEVIGPRGTLFQQGPMAAVYFAPPVYWPDQFGQCSVAGGTAVIAWCIPLTPAEAMFASSVGREQFEDLLATQQPDLASIERAPLRLPPGA